MIEVLDSVPVPQQGTVIRKKAKATSIPASLKKSVQAYSDAYLKVYGIRPEVTFDGAFIRIMGQVQGVTKKRLKEMTNQLKWRAG